MSEVKKGNAFYKLEKKIVLIFNYTLLTRLT